MEYVNIMMYLFLIQCLKNYKYALLARKIVHSIIESEKTIIVAMNIEYHDC